MEDSSVESVWNGAYRYTGITVSKSTKWVEGDISVLLANPPLQSLLIF
jgi:hypothetical protein